MTFQDVRIQKDSEQAVQLGRKFYWLSALSSAVLIVASTLIAYWIWWPIQVYTVSIHPMAVDRTEYSPGDVVEVTAGQVCSDTSGKGELRWRLIGQSGVYILRTSQVRGSKNCMDNVLLYRRLPPEVSSADGPYHLEVTAVIQVNPIRTESKTFITKDFNIIP